MHADTWLKQPRAFPAHAAVYVTKCHTGAYGFTDFKWDSNAAQTSPPVKSPTWPNEPSGRSDHEDFPEKGVDVHVDPAEEILAFELSSDSMTGNSPVKFSAPVTRFRPRVSNYRTDKARGAISELQHASVSCRPSDPEDVSRSKPRQFAV